ncbi:MAG: DUF4440 domain-containing protein [Crocinitomicaceae bacterium]|jgi:hypothetical protein|nr:DUF4440 domain-containing protein [Crocinitomicaceae bacterium]|tara:strand:- start:2151 stop:2612 length:462 start_codon:yes stop_codon:yes gene_type:complete
MRFTASYLIVTSLFILASGQFACTADTQINTIPDEVAQKLKLQEQAWNAGNLERFMGEAYWTNDALMFIGSQGLTFGYDQTLANYHQSYPDPEAMGQLTFKLLQWRQLGDSHGLLVGTWHLERGGDHSNLDGHFSLTWEHRDNEWLIIADHSS